MRRALITLFLLVAVVLVVGIAYLRQHRDEEIDPTTRDLLERCETDTSC
jgi:hypothetical protein